MEKKCPVCGAAMEEDMCSYCGSREKENIQESVYSEKLPENEITYGISQKNKTTALLLCIFLGGLGVHRFYVGKAGTGVLYLCTGGVLGIGWIIDIVRIATGSFRDEFDLLLQ